jgi:hypothetical protein
MRKKKFSQFTVALVFIAVVLACSMPIAAPTESAPIAAPTESAPITAPTESAPIAAPTESAPTAAPGENETLVKLTLVTGSDGTVDNPTFELFDKYGNSLFSITLDNPGDLQPNQTDVYQFSVPHSFCEITGWGLTKPSNSGFDDSWLPTEIYVELDGKIVFFDRLFSDLGLWTASSQSSGNWSGTDIYKQQCGN